MTMALAAIIFSTFVVAVGGLWVAIWSILRTRQQYFDEYVARRRRD